MQTVADLNEDHTDVITHRQQQFLEVLCLCRSLFTEDTSADLGQSVDDLCNLRAEDVFYVLSGIVGILYDIMEQGSADTRRTESYLFAGYLCDGDRMHNIRLTRKTAHSFVCLTGEIECLGDDIHLLTMT